MRTSSSGGWRYLGAVLEFRQDDLQRPLVGVSESDGVSHNQPAVIPSSITSCHYKLSFLQALHSMSAECNAMSQDAEQSHPISDQGEIMGSIMCIKTYHFRMDVDLE